MPDFNSIQMTAPRHPVSGPGIGGRSLHVMRGEFNLSASLAVADRIRLFRLHPRFRIMAGFIKTSGMGAGVTLNVGDAATPNRYFAGVNAANAATALIADTGRDYLNPRYEEVLATIAGAATATSGQLVVVLYGYIEEPA